jgi:hypothetical protein
MDVSQCRVPMDGRECQGQAPSISASSSSVKPASLRAWWLKGLFSVLHAERQQVLAQQAELVRLLRGHALNRCVAADVWHYLICLPGVTHVQDCTTGDSDFSSRSLDQFDSGVTPLG